MTLQNDTGRTPKVGVVLGSGGIKALSAIALFEFLDENHIPVDLLVGCSGGGLLCAARAAGYSSDQMRGMTKLWARKHFKVDYRSLLAIGHPRLGRMCEPSAILKPSRIRAVFNELFGDLKLEELRIKTLLQATDCQSGEGVVLRTGRVADAVYASSACFPLLPAIRIDGRWLIDGAFSAPLPVMEAVKRGMDFIIALDFTQEESTEPRTFFDFFNRSLNATTRSLTGSQMALSIGLHHFEILMINVHLNKNINLWDTKETAFILDSGRKAIEQKRVQILEAIKRFSQGETHAIAES